jgi:hypothetical protein
MRLLMQQVRQEEEAVSPTQPRVLSLCDRTGVMVQPWLEAGFDCTIVDLQHEDTGGFPSDGRGALRKVGADVRTWLPPLDNYGIVFAFPPCTHLAGSGARWWQDKGLSSLIEGLELVEACRRICEWTGAPWMLENPIGSLSSWWREPDWRFDPYEYAGYPGGEDDTYTKRTCLWVGNGFRIPPTRPLEAVDGSKFHLLSPSPERADLRSVTPAGFARAVFEANVELVAGAKAATGFVCPRCGGVVALYGDGMACPDCAWPGTERMRTSASEETVDVA